MNKVNMDYGIIFKKLKDYEKDANFEDLLEVIDETDDVIDSLENLLSKEDDEQQHCFTYTSS